MPAGLLERGGGSGVGAEGGQCQVPGAAVDIGVGQRAGESAVHLASPARRGLAVDGRSGQRMPELELSVTHGHQSGRLRRDERGDILAEQGGGPGKD